jgi:hypothetical protein
MVATDRDLTDIPISSLGPSRLRLSLPLLIALLCYAAIVALGSRVLADPDTYWHIAIGRWIIANRTVPIQDIYSFSMPGAAFTPPEWLAEVIMAWIYDHFGWAGLVAATGLCAAAAVGILLRILLRFFNPVHALIATVLAAGLAAPHVLARPHIFALPILVFWTAELVGARNEDRAPPLWLAVVIIAWANIHSSYILVVGLAGLLGAEAVILADGWFQRFRAARGWALFGLLSTTVALITPFGVDGLLLPFHLIGMPFAFSVVAEWGSPNFQHFQALEIWIVGLLAAGLSLGWRLPPTRIGIVLLLLHMTLKHSRYAEQLGFITPLLLASALSFQLANLGGPGNSSFDRAFASLAKPANWTGCLLAGIMLLGVSAVGFRNGIDHNRGSTPDAAISAAEAQHVEGPVFNDYNFGGYLIFRGIKPFIDGRYFYGDSFIRRFIYAVNLKGDELPVVLTQYGIRWTLLQPDQPAVALLDHLPGWRRVYADEIAVVHARD